MRQSPPRFIAVLVLLLASPSFPPPGAPPLGAQENGAVLKANLDLPFDAGGHEEVDDPGPDLVVFYGQQYEADGIFFCCDKSGSMKGEPFKRLQREVIKSLSAFSERAQFGIVLFDSVTEKFPATGKPAQADPAMKGAAIQWVMSRKPGGHSCYQEALLTALNFANQSTARRKIIIVLGDGILNCPGHDAKKYRSDTLEQVRTKNVAQVRINAICLGWVEVDEEWMRTLATENQGSFARIVQ